MLIDERLICSKYDDCNELNIKPPLFICAPMVRYSKYAFRKLISNYGCDLVYTPMIYSSAFVASEKCREVEFSENETDFPIVQFAANNPEDFAQSAELVYGRCKGIDLNCGCPKNDVRKYGCGSKLLQDPELIADIVRQTRARIEDPNFLISIKIRIENPISRTLELCRQVEKAGVSHIAVHARTVNMRDSEPADYEAVALIKSALSISVFANGGCKSYSDAMEIARITKADGIMAANGILSNPALFAGHHKTPLICVADWLEMDKLEKITPDCFHHHLNFMMRSLLPKPKRIMLCDMKCHSQIRKYVQSVIFDS